MTEIEKIKHITQKYKDSSKVYTIFRRDHTKIGNEFICIYGTDNENKVKSYINEKEQEGKKLIIYCARPKEHISSLYHMTEG